MCIRDSPVYPYCPQIVVGVADASVQINKIFAGKAVGFHIGRSRVVKSNDSHKIRSGGKSLSLDTPRALPTDEQGRLSIIAIVDMTTHRLSIAINDRTPVDTGVKLPNAVRPWVWLGGPGVGSVSLCELALNAPAPSRLTRSLEATQHRRPSDVTTGPTSGEFDISDTPSYDMAGAVVQLRDVSLSESPAGQRTEQRRLSIPPLGAAPAGAPAPAGMCAQDTDRTTSSSQDSDPEPWTARATAWFRPLQQMFVQDNQAEPAQEVRQHL